VFGWFSALRFVDALLQRMIDRYAMIVETCKARFGVRVHRWRPTMSGCAWTADYADGSHVRWVESPYPRSPVSLAIFLHEVGHHAIGFAARHERLDEERRAWEWALRTMAELGVVPDARVRRRFERSMRYEVSKASRRRAA
jgi:hypothetical protein